MQLTKNYIESTFRNVYQVKQGQLDSLLKHCTKLGSNYKNNEWKYDVYLLDRYTVVLAGDADNFGQKLNKSFVQAYDKKIKFILQDTLLDSKENSIEQLLQNFTFIINHEIDCRVD